MPTLFGLAVLLFILLYFLPGDPARLLTGDHELSRQGLSNLRERLGTGGSGASQFARYMRALARGDLGVSYQTRQPVAEIIGATLPRSMLLALMALIVELVVGIPVGVLAALKRDGLYDRGLFFVSALLIAMPVFLLALFFQWTFGITLRWLPTSGFGTAAHFILPALVMGLIAGAYLSRVVRSAMLDVLATEYVLAARANGLPPWRVVVVHALRNALPPVLALAGLHFGFLIGSAVATETVFSWPGLGRRMYNAVLFRDRPVVLGAVLSLSLVFISVNLLVDILQAVINPRIRRAPGAKTHD